MNSAETVQPRIVSVIDRAQFVFNRFSVSPVILAEGIKAMVTVSQLGIDKAEKAPSIGPFLSIEGVADILGRTDRRLIPAVLAGSQGHCQEALWQV